jgi:hypothetical protein
MNPLFLAQIWRWHLAGEPCLAWVQREPESGEKKARFGAHFTQMYEGVLQKELPPRQPLHAKRNSSS